jgi:hypothetical protein
MKFEDITVGCKGYWGLRCDGSFYLFIFLKIGTSVWEKRAISTFKVKEFSVLKVEVAYCSKYVCLSTKVNDVTHQTSMTLKGTVNSRILNLVMLIILNRPLFPVSIKFLLHLEYVYSDAINVSVMQIIVKDFPSLYRFLYTKYLQRISRYQLRCY